MSLPLTLQRASRRAERLARHASRLDRRSSALATLRLVLALAVAAAAGIAWWAPSARLGALATMGACAAAFALAMRSHAGVHRRWRLAQQVAESARRDVTRLQSAWRGLPATGEGLAQPGRESDLAADLSLLGPGSLFQLVCRCATPWGERRLASLLLAAAPAEDLARRQAAVREMAGRPAFRRRLEAEGRVARGQMAGAEALARLLAAPSWIDSRPWLGTVGALIGATTLALGLVALATGVTAPFWIAVLAGMAVTAAVARPLAAVTDPLIDRAGPVLACARMLALVERRAGRGELPRQWAAATTDPVAASAALARLGRLLEALSLRRNAFWLPVQALLSWELWQCARLARWKRLHGAAVPRWLEILADAESCGSLASHAELFGGCLAEVSGDGPAFVAEGLVHPLLPPEQAVPNDLALEGPGRVLLLTGSNMSGKSTLLRAAGCAAVLALAGGPAPARTLKMRACRTWTSIRVTDALDEGVSLFYAEVRRLKSVLTEAERAASGQGPAVLFLVDEILRGTNTRERHAAARAIVARLAAAGAAGIVTSHDVELADMEGTIEGVVNGHFREEIREGRMTFDYRLRRGPVTTSNALAILRLEGLDVDRRD